MNKNSILCSLACIVSAAAGFATAWLIQQNQYEASEEAARLREKALVNEIYEVTKELKELKDKERFPGSDSNGGSEPVDGGRAAVVVSGDDKPATVFDVAWYEGDEFLPGEAEDSFISEIKETARNVKRTAPEAEQSWRSISPDPVILNTQQAAEFDSYEQDSWTWYEGDCVMSDGLDNAFGDWASYIGTDWMDKFGPEGVNPDDPDTLYIRRDIDGVLIEIARTPESYAESHEGLYD